MDGLGEFYSVQWGQSVPYKGSNIKSAEGSCKEQFRQGLVIMKVDQRFLVHNRECILNGYELENSNGNCILSDNGLKSSNSHCSQND